MDAQNARCALDGVTTCSCLLGLLQPASLHCQAAFDERLTGQPACVSVSCTVCHHRYTPSLQLVTFCMSCHGCSRSHVSQCCEVCCKAMPPSASGNSCTPSCRPDTEASDGPETESSDEPETETSDGQLSLRVWLADGEERPGLGALL